MEDNKNPNAEPGTQSPEPASPPVPIFLIAATRCNKLQLAATPGRNHAERCLQSCLPRAPKPYLSDTRRFYPTQPGTVTWLNSYIVTITPTRTSCPRSHPTRNPEPLNASQDRGWQNPPDSLIASIQHPASRTNIQNPHPPIQMSKNVASAVALSKAEKNSANDKRSRVRYDSTEGRTYSSR